MDIMIKQTIERAWKKPLLGSCLERANLHFENNHLYVDCRSAGLATAILIGL